MRRQRVALAGVTVGVGLVAARGARRWWVGLDWFRSPRRLTRGVPNRCWEPLWADPTFYGAVADGITDCTPGLQAAIDYAGLFEGGGIVSVPGPVMRISEPVLITGDGVTIKPMTLELSEPGDVAVRIDGASNTRLEGVTIIGKDLPFQYGWPGLEA